MTDDTDKLREQLREELQEIGTQRAAALDELENARQRVQEILPKVRDDELLTWREIATLTHYTENRLQRIWAGRKEQGED